MLYQRTIKKEISAIGIGLHSGCRVKITMKPAPINHGIVFIRMDISGQIPIKVEPYLINDTRLSSNLVVEMNGQIVRVCTIEHLMSALACYGIDNIVIELSNQEVPIMDGSASAFLYLLDQAYVVEQEAKKKYLKIKKEIYLEDKHISNNIVNKWVKLEPYNGYKLNLTIDFDHILFKKELSTLTIDFDHDCYIKDISRARTFGFVHEIEYMKNKGLGQGGNLDNAIVIGEDAILNQDQLRYKDEFVRHKMLDAIGDLYVLGMQIIGYFSGYKSGHAMNNYLLRKLLEDKSNYDIVSFNTILDVPNCFNG